MANFSVEWLSKSYYDEVREAARVRSAPEELTKEPRSQAWPTSPNIADHSEYSSESEVEAKGRVQPAGPQERRKSKPKFTPRQVTKLEKTFSMYKYVTPSQRKKISKKLKLSDTQVKTWFQNRRMRFKRALRAMRPQFPRVPALLLPRLTFQHRPPSGQLPLPARGGFHPRLQPRPQPLSSPAVSFAPAADSNTPLNLSLRRPH